MLGRPSLRDFHFQNSRNPFRCERTNVSGFTTVRADGQSKDRINCASIKRSESVARRGFCFRSTYIACCLRRKRFSAARADEDRSRRYTNVLENGEDGESENTSVAEHERKNLINRANEYDGDGFSADGVFAEHSRSARFVRGVLTSGRRKLPILGLRRENHFVQNRVGFNFCGRQPRRTR